jgi:hypothetical protein
MIIMMEICLFDFNKHMDTRNLVSLWLSSFNMINIIIKSFSWLYAWLKEMSISTIIKWPKFRSRMVPIALLRIFRDDKIISIFGISRCLELFLFFQVSPSAMILYLFLANLLEIEPQLEEYLFLKLEDFSKRFWKLLHDMRCISEAVRVKLCFPLPSLVHWICKKYILF